MYQFTQKFKPIIFMYINISIVIKRIPHIQCKLIRGRHLLYHF